MPVRAESALSLRQPNLEHISSVKDVLRRLKTPEDHADFVEQFIDLADEYACGIRRTIEDLFKNRMQNHGESRSGPRSPGEPPALTGFIDSREAGGTVLGARAGIGNIGLDIKDGGRGHVDVVVLNEPGRTTELIMHCAAAPDHSRGYDTTDYESPNEVLRLLVYGGEEETRGRFIYHGKPEYGLEITEHSTPTNLVAPQERHKKIGELLARNPDIVQFLNRYRERFNNLMDAPIA